MHDLHLIPTLTGGLAAALVLGYVTHRLGLSPIVGYLLAGLAVGPYTPGFVADRGMAEQLAEIGVILLMFGVGLHFHLNELLAVRRVAIPGAIGQIIAATLLGAVVAVFLGPAAEGWTWVAGLVFGLAISVASTVVLVRVLADNRDLHTPTGHVAVGWLVVEDLFTVVVLVLLPALFPLPPGADAHGRAGQPSAAVAMIEGADQAIAPLVSPYHDPAPASTAHVTVGSASAGGSALTALAVAAIKIGILVALVFVVGGRAVPWLLNHAAETRSRELFTLTVLVTALGIAVLSAQVFGVSMALGAFLAGMIVGRSEFSLRAASEALPMRDAFAVLFFVSVGMLFNPAHLFAAPLLVAATLGVVLIGKPLAAAVIVLVLGHPPRTALAVAVALAQIGEFSFMLAVLGNQLKILPQGATQTLVAAAIVSITLNPLLYRLVGPAEAWAAKRPKLWKWLNSRVRKQLPAAGESHDKTESPRSADPQRRAVIVGFGPVGRTAARLLRENGIEPTIIELNIETVRRLLSAGEPAVYGDAGRRDTLEEAGASRAGSLILTASGLHDSEEIIRLARELNPKIRVLARSEYVREMPALRAAGAQTVFSGEGEVALALTVALLRGLGATPDQIDRERERVHSELSSGAAPPDLPAEGAVGPAPEAVVFEPAPAEAPPAAGAESTLPKGEVPTAAKGVDHAASKPVADVPPTQPELPPG